MALSAPLKIERKLRPTDEIIELTVATGVTIYAGSIVQTNAGGEAIVAVAAAAASGIKVVGVACETVTAAAAGTRIKVQTGVFKLVNSGSFTAASRFDPCYITDDAAVNATDTNKFAGYIYEYESAGFVWVLLSPFNPLPA